MRIDNCRECDYFSQNDGIGGYYCFFRGRPIYKVRRCHDANLEATNHNIWAGMLADLMEIQIEDGMRGLFEGEIIQ